MKMFFLLKLLVFDARVTKSSFEPVNIPPAPKQKGFQKFFVEHKKL